MFIPLFNGHFPFLSLFDIAFPKIAYQIQSYKTFYTSFTPSLSCEKNIFSLSIEVAGNN